MEGKTKDVNTAKNRSVTMLVTVTVSFESPLPVSHLISMPVPVYFPQEILDRIIGCATIAYGGENFYYPTDDRFCSWASLVSHTFHWHHINSEY